MLQQTCITLIKDFEHAALNILDQGYEESFQAWSQQNRQKTRELYDNTEIILAPKFELTFNSELKLLKQ